MINVLEIILKGRISLMASAIPLSATLLFSSAYGSGGSALQSPREQNNTVIKTIQILQSRATTGAAAPELFSQDEERKNNMSKLTKLTKPMPRLPSAIVFSESMDGGTFKMCMDLGCATANMQEDKAAFEAWALCARAAGYVRVELSGNGLPQASEISKPKRLHYNRFLYRALRFAEGFAWFALSPDLEQKAKEFESKELLENNLFVSAPECEASLVGNTPEAKKERELIRPRPLDALSNIDVSPKYHSQLPVGLFYKEVKNEAAIFPGDKAAIDIWGLSGNTFHLVELKVGKASKLGVLSETFFYACFVRDMYCRFHLERKASADQIEKNYRGYGELVKANINSVVAHILTEHKRQQLIAAFAVLQECKLDGIRFGNLRTLSELEKRK